MWRKWQDMIKRWIKSFEVRVAVVIFAAVFVVGAIGLTTYSSLKKIVSGVSESAHRDEKLLLLKEILSEITDAESYAKSFTFTNDEKYLVPYVTILKSTDKKLLDLRKMSKQSQTERTLDSLSLLVHRKFMVLNEFIALRDTGRIEVVLSNLSEKISPGVTESERIRQKKEKENLISKILNRTRKRPKINPPAKSGVTTFRDVQQEIERLRFLEEENAEDLAKAQIDLTEQDKLIMESIRAIFQRLETKERETLALKTAEAERLAEQTNKNITAFSIGLAVMLFALGYFILRNIKKSRDYSKQLEIAKLETEQLAEAKELFLANMSHEIRTPLHAITGFSEQLIGADLKPAQKEQLEIIKKSGDHLLKLVNNVLDLTKIHAGKLVEITDSFKPDDMFIDVLNVVRPLANEKRIELTSRLDSALPGMLVGDPVKLRQILINLLSNAVKFTEVGKVELVAKVIEEDKEKVKLEIVVSDTGIGISEDQIETIFDEFVQVSNKNSMKYGGTGLGLTIAKKLSEFLGGDLSITSSKGNGTVVTVHLPFKIRVHAKTASDGVRLRDIGIDLSGTKVLIADDEVFNLKLLGLLLQKWDAQYTSVNNGAEVLAALEKANFDVVLIDLSMPEMDGFETARRIRASESGESKIPIVALTASAEPEIVHKCNEAGIEFVLTKPYMEEELLALIVQILFPNQDLKSLKRKGRKKKVESYGGPEDSYDLENLKSLAPGDKEFTRDMLETFLESTQKNFVALKAALKIGDTAKMSEMAHALAAPCRHLAMTSVVEILKKIEHINGNETISNETINLVEALDDKFRALLPQLREEVNAL